MLVRNYRSIGPDGVRIKFPKAGPLVLFGENNAGKTNIARSIELLFGERWPGTHQPEDHDFHGRDRESAQITVAAQVSNVTCPYCHGEADKVWWKYDQCSDSNPCTYLFHCMGCTRSYVRKDLREQIVCISLQANRNLGYQLSYTSKYTLLSKLMHRFHQELVGDEYRKSRLKSIFKESLEQFESVPEFATFRHTLTEMTADLGQSLSYRLEVDFSAYDPSNFFQSLRVHPTLDDEPRSFDELGSGQAEILAFVFAYAYAKAFGKDSSLVLVVDEPESHLHPLAQQWLANRLKELVTDGLQIVINTHSPHFVDLSQPENLVAVRRDHSDAPTRINQVSRADFVEELRHRGASPDRTTEESIGEFYSASATTEIRSGIFAKSAVLVEGPTEAYALPGLLRLTGLDPLRYGIAFVNVEGLSNIAKWHRLYGIFGVPVYVIFDTDSKQSGKNAEKSRIARADLMVALGYPIEQAEKMSPEPIDVQERYATLNPNFEGAMSIILGETWSNLKNEAQGIVGESKPLIARYVTSHLRQEDVAEIGILTTLTAQLIAITPAIKQKL